MVENICQYANIVLYRIEKDKKKIFISDIMYLLHRKF
jgi:hypothetical protein